MLLYGTRWYAMARERRRRVCYIRRMTQHTYWPGALPGTPGAIRHRTATGVTRDTA